MTQVHAIQCKNCLDTVFSRATHDMRSCSCEQVSIDGGFDYTRIVAKITSDYIEMKISIDQTPMELYEDWNSRKDEYGIIKIKKKERKRNEKTYLLL